MFMFMVFDNRCETLQRTLNRSYTIISSTTYMRYRLCGICISTRLCVCVVNINLSLRVSLTKRYSNELSVLWTVLNRHKRVRYLLFEAAVQK